MASSNRSTSASRRSSQRPPVYDDGHREKNSTENVTLEGIVKAIEELQTKSVESDGLRQRVDKMSADIEEIKALITQSKSTGQSFQSSGNHVAGPADSSDMPLEQQSEYAMKNVNDVIEKIISERRVLLIQLEDKEKEVESCKRLERQSRKQVKQLQEELAKFQHVGDQQNINGEMEGTMQDYVRRIQQLELERNNLRTELDQEKRTLIHNQDEMEAHKQAAIVYKQDFEEERLAREKLATQLEMLKTKGHTAPENLPTSAGDRLNYRETEVYKERPIGTRVGTLPDRFSSSEFSSFTAGGIQRTWLCRHCSTRNVYSSMYCQKCSRMHVT